MYFFVLAFRLGVVSQKPLSNSRSSTLVFSSKSFIGLALTFSSMIDFELIFMYFVRKGLNFFVCGYPISPAPGESS